MEADDDEIDKTTGTMQRRKLVLKEIVFLWRCHHRCCLPWYGTREEAEESYTGGQTKLKPCEALLGGIPNPKRLGKVLLEVRPFSSLKAGNVFSFFAQQPHFLFIYNQYRSTIRGNFFFVQTTCNSFFGGRTLFSLSISVENGKKKLKTCFERREYFCSYFFDERRRSEIIQKKMTFLEELTNTFWAKG